MGWGYRQNEEASVACSVTCSVAKKNCRHGGRLTIWSRRVFGAVACSCLRARKNLLVGSRYGRRRVDPTKPLNPTQNRTETQMRRFSIMFVIPICTTTQPSANKRASKIRAATALGRLFSSVYSSCMAYTRYVFTSLL